MRKKSRLWTFMSAGCAVLIAALVLVTGCTMTGVLDDEIKKGESSNYPPAEAPLASISVEDSSGKNYLTNFEQNNTEYLVMFAAEQRDEPLVIKATAVSPSAGVLIKIGSSVHSESGELSTSVPESSMRIRIFVSEGSAATEYELLLYAGGAAATSNELTGYVRITGNIELGEKLIAELSYDYNEKEANTTYTWFRNNEQVSSTTGSGGAVYPVTSSDNQAVIKVEVTSSKKSGVLSASRSASEWVSMDVVQIVIDTANDLINGLKPVVGDSAKNPLSLMRISDLIAELNTLKKGVQHTREVLNTSGEMETEVYTVYDRPALTEKTNELAGLIQTSSGITDIIVGELVFEYTGVEQTVILMSNNDAVYQIELIGASGGHIYGKPPKNKQSGTEGGGKGARLVARYNLAKGTEYTIRVGGQGSGTAVWDEATQLFNRIAVGYSTPKQGGWPNGGGGGSSYNNDTIKKLGEFPAGSGGGGSTDIRLKTSTGAFSGTSSDPRFMVAAGGGGAAQSNNAWLAIRGANMGEDGLVFTGETEVPESSKRPNTGASASDSGETGLSYGRDGENECFEGRGGGGGGYKGGQAITSKTYKGVEGVTGSGAGGSNYIKTDGSHIDGFDDVTEVYPAYSNGQAVVTWIRN